MKGGKLGCRLSYLILEVEGKWWTGRTPTLHPLRSEQFKSTRALVHSSPPGHLLTSQRHYSSSSCYLPQEKEKWPLKNAASLSHGSHLTKVESVANTHRLFTIYVCKYINVYVCFMGNPTVASATHPLFPFSITKAPQNSLGSSRTALWWGDRESTSIRSFIWRFKFNDATVTSESQQTDGPELRSHPGALLYNSGQVTGLNILMGKCKLFFV